MTILIAIDRHWAGFYIHRDYALRICLGWIAITILPNEEQAFLEGYIEYIEKCRKVEQLGNALLEDDDIPDEFIPGILEGFKEALNGDALPVSEMWDGIDVDEEE